MKGKLCSRIWITFVYDFVLRMFDFGWWQSIALNDRGQFKKTEGADIAQKARAVVWLWVYLPSKSQCPPPPPITFWGLLPGVPPPPLPILLPTLDVIRLTYI